MSNSWEKRIKEIEQRVLEEGYSGFETWSDIQAVMLTGENAVAANLYYMSVWGGNIDEINGVLEIGGGYGSMYKHWRDNGYDGEWYIYDYPVMMSLQEYYAESCGLMKPTRATFPIQVDMLIACYSLSEMDSDERDLLMSDIEFDRYLITYVPRWGGVDNEEYFKSWPGETIQHKKFENVRIKTL